MRRAQAGAGCGMPGAGGAECCASLAPHSPRAPRRAGLAFWTAADLLTDASLASRLGTYEAVNAAPAATSSVMPMPFTQWTARILRATSLPPSRPHASRKPSRACVATPRVGTGDQHRRAV